MSKTLIYRLSTTILVLWCLLAAIGAEAQYLAQDMEMYSDKLGLTDAQKASIAAIRKDLDNQSNAINRNHKLDGDERESKRHEMAKSERARVNKVLTPAQQQKFKDLMHPKEHWCVQADVTVGVDLAHYTARLDGHPAEYLSYTIRKQDIKLRTLDAHGVLVPNGPRLTLATNVPDVITPVYDGVGWRTCRVDFVLERQNAKPGFYNIQFSAAVDATDAETGEHVKLRDAVVGSARVYLTPQPDGVPDLKPGQRFIGNPWEQAGASTVSPYRDAYSGKPITWGEIALRVATLQLIEPGQHGSRLTFALEGHPGLVFLETERQATNLPYLIPLVTEPTVRALQSEYQGKQVWCYGGPGAQCVSTVPGMSIGLSGGVDLPLRIKRVERMCVPRIELAIGNATFVGGDRESAFATDNSLIVILDASAKGLKFNGLFYAGDEDIDKASEDVESNPRAHCLGLWDEVSDRWDFERKYCLSNPLKIHPTWSTKMRKAVLNGELINGMTRDMVAWVMGWPAIYGTKAEMLSLDEWTYDNIPHKGHVYFKNGRVADQLWPSLP